MKFPEKKGLPSPAGYGLAVAATAVCALMRAALPSVLAPAPYLGFYPGVVVSAALGGVGPGLVATILSAFLVNFVFGTINPADHGSLGRQIVWITASLGVSLLAGRLRQAHLRERQHAAEVASMNEQLREEISERKLIEIELRGSEERYRRLFENMSEGATLSELVVDLHGDPVDLRYLSVNPAFEAYLQLRAEHVVGRTLGEVHPMANALWLDKFASVALTGSSVQFEEQFAPLQRWFKISAFQTKPGQIATVFFDITKRRERENTLRKLNDELEIRVAQRTAELAASMEKLKQEMTERWQAVDELRRQEQLLIQQSRLAAMGEMINNIAHQWRQPLNTLGLLIQQFDVLNEYGELTPEVIRANVRGSMKLINHMSKTVDDFRDYLKPEKELVDFSVIDTVHNTLSIVEGSFKHENIEVSITEQASPVLRGFPNEFAHSILNILNNAKDALLERKVAQPRVAVVVSDDAAGRTVVSITDNAGGISEEALPRIFDPYFTTKGADGTGLGLYMTKTIIETKMHGHLSVRNTEIGAQFTIEV